MIVTTKAIIATGSYAPRRSRRAIDVIPQGAEEADGADAIARVVRSQIKHGADWIKVYADYRWGPNGETRPTFTLDELKLMVEIAGSSGRPVVAHAISPEGMRRAIIAGARSIEHANFMTAESIALMKQHGTFLCPTLAVGNAPEKRAMVKQAFDAGVAICAGGDAGVFTHGENALEAERLVAAGLTPLQALMSVTSVNARMLEMEETHRRDQAGNARRPRGGIRRPDAGHHRDPARAVRDEERHGLPAVVPPAARRAVGGSARRDRQPAGEDRDLVRYRAECNGRSGADHRRQPVLAIPERQYDNGHEYRERKHSERDHAGAADGMRNDPRRPGSFFRSATSAPNSRLSASA